MRFEIRDLRFNLNLDTFYTLHHTAWTAREAHSAHPWRCQLTRREAPRAGLSPGRATPLFQAASRRGRGAAAEGPATAGRRPGAPAWMWWEGEKFFFVFLGRAALWPHCHAHTHTHTHKDRHTVYLGTFWVSPSQPAKIRDRVLGSVDALLPKQAQSAWGLLNVAILTH